MFAFMVVIYPIIKGIAMSSSILIEQVHHQFSLGQEKISLFNGINASIESGHSYAIVGPSGVGKSSLLLILAGLEMPTKGKVRYEYKSQQALLSQLRQRSGFIFQQFHLLPELDALNNIALPLKLKGDKEAMTKAEKWLVNVGLKGRAHHKPTQLSGGEQQRVAIARALVSEPDFIFADEPTGNLDEHTAKQIAELMYSCCRESNAALVLVTHSEDLASQADYLFTLGQGKLIISPSKQLSAQQVTA